MILQWRLSLIHFTHSLNEMGLFQFQMDMLDHKVRSLKAYYAYVTPAAVVTCHDQAT